MRTLTAILTAAAVPVALAAAVAAPTSGAGDGTVIRYLSTNPQNTDLDLDGNGKTSVGDRQVFKNTAMRDGTQIGYEVGEAVMVEVTDNGLKAAISSTLVLTNGTITLSGVFIEDDFTQGPVGFTAAVTGGTGRYHGATGQAVGEFIPGTNDVKTTIRLE